MSDLEKSDDEDDERRLVRIRSLIQKRFTQIYSLKSRDYTELLLEIRSLGYYGQCEDEMQCAHQALEYALIKYPTMDKEQHQFIYELFLIIEKYYKNTKYRRKIRRFEKEICTFNDHPITYDIIDYIYLRDQNVIRIMTKLKRRIIRKKLKNKKLMLEKYFYMVTHFHMDYFDDMVTMYYDYDDFKLILIQYYREKNQYEKALQICQDGKNKNNKLCYYDQCIEIYQITQQYSKLKEEYMRVVFHVRPGNLHYYKGWQNCFSKDEWNQKKKKIFYLLEEHGVNMIGIYSYEKLYLELLQYLKKYNDLIHIRRNEKLFMKFTIMAVACYYQEVLLLLTEKCHRRPIYKGMMHYLEVIYEMNIDKGNETVSLLIDKYPRKYALCKEMKLIQQKSRSSIGAFFEERYLENKREREEFLRMARMTRKK